MRWFAIAILALIMSLASIQTAHAELLTETISGIEVPTNITFGAQLEWQGHIIYEIKDLGTTYEAQIARDSAPHQLPYFYVSFNKNWDYMGTTRHFNPELEKKAAEDRAKAERDAAQKAQEDARRVEQDSQRREVEKKRKPEVPDRPREPVKPRVPAEPTRPPEDQPDPVIEEPETPTGPDPEQGVDNEPTQ